MSTGSRAQFDGLVSERGERLSNDPDILRAELAAHGLRRPTRRCAASATGARAARARCARPPRATAFEAMLPNLMRAIAAGPDPEPRAQPLQRHRRAPVERGQFLPLARSPAAARRAGRANPHPRARARRPARAPPDPARRADRRQSRFALPPEAGELAARFSAAIASDPLDVALDRVRRMVNERRFALGRPADHRAPRPDRRRRGL